MASKLAEFHKDDFIPYIPPAPLDEFCIFGLVYANEGKEDLLEAAYAECIRDAQGYEGIIHYCLTRDPDDPTAFHIFERYTGRKPFDDRHKTPVIQKLWGDGLVKGIKAKYTVPIQAAK